MSTINNRAALERLGLYYLKRERRIKQEIAVTSFLWLVGCPFVCWLVPDEDTLYGKPDEMGICGLLSYSVSSSMTGLYPKVLGSILAPLFAVLVVQRSSNGLCSNLKLGWMLRYSTLISTTSKGGNGSAARPDEKTVLLAVKLWRRIERIELFGYAAACCLVALVAFDAKDFVFLHIFFASAAFFFLSQQNRLVGTLAKDEDFGAVFSNWADEHGRRVFYWGMFHLAVMYGFYFFFGTLKHFGRCNDLLVALEAVSLKAFGNPTTMRWIASVAFWFNEYAFAFMSIYVQLLAHYDFRVTEFIGESNMPYMAVVSRFSICGSVEQILGISPRPEVFLGLSKASNKKE